MADLDPYFDADKILADNDARVEFSDEVVDSDGNLCDRGRKFACWSLVWKHGTIGWCRPDWTQEQANRAGAMFIYLWQRKVDVGAADTLAGLWAEHVTMNRL